MASIFCQDLVSKRRRLCPEKQPASRKVHMTWKWKEKELPPNKWLCGWFEEPSRCQLLEDRAYSKYLTEPSHLHSYHVGRFEFPGCLEWLRFLQMVDTRQWSENKRGIIRGNDLRWRSLFHAWWGIGSMPKLNFSTISESVDEIDKLVHKIKLRYERRAYLLE